MTARLPSWVSPVWLVVASIISVQVGAAFAKSLFTLIGPRPWPGCGWRWLRASSG